MIDTASNGRGFGKSDMIKCSWELLPLIFHAADICVKKWLSYIRKYLICKLNQSKKLDCAFLE